MITYKGVIIDRTWSWELLWLGAPHTPIFYPLGRDDSIWLVAEERFEVINERVLDRQVLKFSLLNGQHRLCSCKHSARAFSSEI